MSKRRSVIGIGRPSRQRAGGSTEGSTQTKAKADKPLKVRSQGDDDNKIMKKLRIYDRNKCGMNLTAGVGQKERESTKQEGGVTGRASNKDSSDVQQVALALWCQALKRAQNVGG